MGKKRSVSVRQKTVGTGKFVELRIVSQHNSYEILFKGRARLGDKKETAALFEAARLKGL